LQIVADGRTAAEVSCETDVSLLDVVLVDADETLAEAASLLREVRAVAGNAGILVLSTRMHHAVAMPMVRNGARGLIPKDAPPDLLRMAIRKVREGELWLDRATTSQIILDMASGGPAAGNRAQAGIDSLTSRERGVIGLITTGMSNKAIARNLGISDSTVRHHLTSIFSKLEIQDRIELVLFALEHNIEDSRSRMPLRDSRE